MSVRSLMSNLTYPCATYTQARGSILRGRRQPLRGNIASIPAALRDGAWGHRCALQGGTGPHGHQYRRIYDETLFLHGARDHGVVQVRASLYCIYVLLLLQYHDSMSTNCTAILVDLFIFRCYALQTVPTRVHRGSAAAVPGQHRGTNVQGRSGVSPQAPPTCPSWRRGTLRSFLSCMSKFSTSRKLPRLYQSFCFVLCCPDLLHVKSSSYCLSFSTLFDAQRSLASASGGSLDGVLSTYTGISVSGAASVGGLSTSLGTSAGTGTGGHHHGTETQRVMTPPLIGGRAKQQPPGNLLLPKYF